MGIDHQGPRTGSIALPPSVLDPDGRYHSVASLGSTLFVGGADIIGVDISTDSPPVKLVDSGSTLAVAADLLSANVVWCDIDRVRAASMDRPNFVKTLLVLEGKHRCIGIAVHPRTGERRH